MRKKPSFYLFILPAIFINCWLATTVYGQGREQFVEWNSKRILSWDDFKGKVDELDQVHAAVTFAGIEIKIEKVEFFGTAHFKAKAVFDRNQSWVHPARKAPQILAHEQLHFDITEVYARKLEQKLNSLKLKVGNKEEINRIKKLYLKTHLEIQARFDEETLHGLHPLGEKNWRLLIDQELQHTTPLLIISPQAIPFSDTVHK